MPDQKPIIWTNPNGRRHWWRALKHIRFRPRLRIRSEMINLAATVMIAIATTGAAMAAYYSVKAADRQEEATYQSQLYNEQIVLIGPVFAGLSSFNNELVRALSTGDVPHLFGMLLNDSKSRSDFVTRSRLLQSALVSHVGALDVTFPNRISFVANLAASSLGRMASALEQGPVGSSDFSDAMSDYNWTNRLLDGCVKPLLRKGKPLTNAACDSFPLS
jgi:hypothetical protein